MKKILYVILCCLFVSCISNKVTVTTYNQGKYMQTALDTVVGTTAFVNICANETIPTSLKKWVGMAVVDYETNNIIKKYLYIQKMDTTEVVYTLIPNDTLYHLNKRITTNSK